MLIGLHLRDFALAERVELDLRGGFTVITGETGAGKSVLIQALTFALGFLRRCRDDPTRSRLRGGGSCIRSRRQRRFWSNRENALRR